MRHIANLPEEQMIAAFLRGEIASERFGEQILSFLQRDRMDRRVVDAPDLSNEVENVYRRRLLGDFRGYGRDSDHFRHFPSDVSWHRYGLTPSEVIGIRYIDYSYWNELSGGTRMPKEAASNIRQGLVVLGQSHDRFWKAVRALEAGETFPELILVGTAPDTQLVALEGHLRLTAYNLAPDRIPNELTAIVGFSCDLTRWLALPPSCSELKSVKTNKNTQRAEPDARSNADIRHASC